MLHEGGDLHRDPAHEAWEGEGGPEYEPKPPKRHEVQGQSAEIRFLGNTPLSAEVEVQMPSANGSEAQTL